MQRPVEGKVKATTLAASVSGAIVWALGAYVFRGAVPEEVAGLVALAVPAVLTFAAGWLTKHTWRTDADARAQQPRIQRPPEDG